MRNGSGYLKGCRSVAVMGGTFDPIHYGHLVTAEAVRYEFGIERILFIPSGHPPHKENALVSGSEHRYLMTVLATVANPFFDVSRIEIDRPGLSYTVDTINILREECGEQTQLYFITGADAVHQILGWKDAERLLTLCNFIAVTRPGYSGNKLNEQIIHLKKNFKSKLHFLEVPALAISSTDIRSRVSEGQPIKYLLPVEVEEYIMKFGLYGRQTNIVRLADDKGGEGHVIEHMIRMLKNNLSTERYIHTMGVANEAVVLARRFGENENKAYIAGLLHDCAKEFSGKEKKKLCDEFNIKLDKIMKKNVDLAHGFISAGIARRDFGVTDEDILNAIKYHTTGRSDMSLLEKILFVADMAEPGRSYPDVNEIRMLAMDDIDGAAYKSIERKITFSVNKDRDIHPLGLEALESLRAKS